jgi:hypothetical protein
MVVRGHQGAGGLEEAEEWKSVRVKARRRIRQIGELQFIRDNGFVGLTGFSISESMW